MIISVSYRTIPLISTLSLKFIISTSFRFFPLFFYWALDFNANFILAASLRNVFITVFFLQAFLWPHPACFVFFVGPSLTLSDLIICSVFFFITRIILVTLAYILSLISNFVALWSENMACYFCFGEFVVMHVWKEYYLRFVDYENIYS